MKKLTKKDFRKLIDSDFDANIVASQIIEMFESELNKKFCGMQKSDVLRLNAHNTGRINISSFIYNADALDIVKKEFEPRGFSVDSTPATGIKLNLMIWEK